jgi:hypothetical protein
MGVAEALMKRALIGYDVVFAKHTSPAMYRVRKRNGFRDVRNATYLTARLRMLRHPTPRNILLWVAAAPARLRKLYTRSNATAQFVQAFDQSFDAMDGEHDDASVRASKPAQWLNWRYGGVPGRDYSIIRVEQAGSLIGAAVLRHAHGRLGWLVDVIGARTEQHLEIIVAHAHKHALALGWDELRTFTTSSRARSVLRRSGFVASRSTPQFTYLPVTDIEMSDELVWSFWHGDSDGELYF